MKGTGYDCSTELCGDALIYIEQLEKKCHQLERERDAAVEDVRNARDCCHFCKNDDGLFKCKTTPKSDHSCFEWRGVKEE